MNKLLDTLKLVNSNNNLRGPYRPYATLPGETEVVISRNYATDETGDVDIDVYIESPCDTGFKTIRINIPSLRVEYVDGMSEDEITYYRKFVCRRCSDIVGRVEEIWNASDNKVHGV